MAGTFRRVFQPPAPSGGFGSACVAAFLAIASPQGFGRAHADESSAVFIRKAAVICRSFETAKTMQWTDAAGVASLIARGKCYRAAGDAPTISAAFGPDIVAFRTADNPRVRKFTLVENTFGSSDRTGGRSASAGGATAIVIGGEDGPACGFAGTIVGLDPGADGFLSVRNGVAGKRSPEIDRLFNGDEAFICAKDGPWLGAVYGGRRRLDAECGVDKPWRLRQPYSGPCSFGWIHSRYVRVRAISSEGQSQAEPRREVTRSVQPPSASEPPKSGASSGTGFFVTARGEIATNAHVVDGCRSIIVKTSQGDTVSATVAAKDAANDLAVLTTTLAPKTTAAIRSGVRLGESVAAFGFPLADVLASSGNFTPGAVTALSGLGDDSRYLQISAPVQPGNSGGPLLDQGGAVVGLVSAKLNALKFMLATNGDIPQNVNFAIKGRVLANFLESSRVAFTEGELGQPVAAPDLADKATAMSVFIVCR